MTLWWVAYPVIGAVVGFLAGLLGIGGGMVMVPMMVFVFTATGFPAETLIHQAIATSMATILFTSLSSVHAHHRRGAVDWAIARSLVPGVLAGAFVLASVAAWLPRRPLAVLFCVFLLCAAVQMLLDLRPRSTRSLPGAGGLFVVGSVIGGVSSLLAAGGAFMTIPFLAWCQVPLRRAIGTAAAVGFPIAAAGTAGYVLNGLRIAPLPPGSIGYVYLPALALIVITSMLAAPWGAALAHRLPVASLRMVFAVSLLLVIARMLWTL